MIAVLLCLVTLSTACCPTLCLKNSIDDYVCNSMYSLATHKIVGRYCITAYTDQVCKYSNSCGRSCDCDDNCGNSILYRQYPTYAVYVQGYYNDKNGLWLVENSRMWFGSNISTIPPADDFPYGCQKHRRDMHNTSPFDVCVRTQSSVEKGM